jgi:hypothetical protein
MSWNNIQQENLYLLGVQASILHKKYVGDPFLEDL